MFCKENGVKNVLHLEIYLVFKTNREWGGMGTNIQCFSRCNNDGKARRPLILAASKIPTEY